ncbi:hypothetical protein AMELA_G00187550 [Ameiurus melas]|uniref:TNFR-Cys domain-containing protein n=1 Tax=Ameiurus melas TaxID=219545 RepID=A0A7J6A842_AMEME|nr:hypothetical protein AMELA_G00187550 [Ameiurus melas]
MLWQSFYIIWSFLCLLWLDQIHVSFGIRCEPGERVTLAKNKCEPCPAKQYNAKQSESIECQNCDPCENGETICEKCPVNTFTNAINSECQPLPQCIQSSEAIPGNATSDINCRNEAEPAVPPSSSLPLSSTSTGTSTMTLTTSRNSISNPTTSFPVSQASRKHALWLAAVAAFLLLILILKLSRCPKTKIDIVRQGSACGKPVEESGEKFLPPV